MIENSSHSDLLAQLADDFGARYRRGERPTPDEYARKYPQLAAQIHDLLPTIALLEQVEPETNSPPVEGPGKHVGPYKLLEKIGEGAFGVVFMAEQQQPIRRKVAIKVLKAGMDTRQVVARFEAERQALAMMDHENI